MRRLIPVLASLVLLAACSGSAATPSAAPAATTAAMASAPTPTTPPPSATAGPTASSSPASATGLVTYDGKTCSYTGPTVLAERTELHIQFAPSAETYTLSWAPALHGTTLAELKKEDGKAAVGPDYGGQMPEWALGSESHSSFGSGTVTVTLTIYPAGDQAYDGLVLACAKSTPAKSDPTAVNLVEIRSAALIAIMPG